MPLPQPPSTPSESNDANTARPLPPPDRRLRQRLTDGAQPCYRHPNRTGGRQCTRCGKHACADCLSQAAVGSHCADCAKAARPDIKTRARYWQASKPALVAYTLIGINVAVFVGLYLLYGIQDVATFRSHEGHGRFALTERAIGGQTSIIPTQDGVVTLTSGNEWYRLLTSGFVHYGVIHLALNCYFIFVLGSQLEQTLGRWKFLLVYMASLLGGSAGALLLEGNSLGAGASGAVYGLMGAYSIGVWQRGINPLTTPVGRLLMINLVFTFVVGFVSVGGHLGGLAAGALSGAVTMAPAYKKYPDWARWAAPLAVGVAAIVLSFLAARVF